MTNHHDNVHVGARKYPAEYSANSGLNDKTIRKGALTVLFTLIAVLALLYHSMYSLEIGLRSGYSAQIPLIFWPALVGTLVMAFLLCTSASSDSSKFGYLILISVLINYSQYIFFNFRGGDSAGEISRWFVIKGLSQFSVELFGYFQWPIHFLFFESFNKILSLPLMDMMRLGYLSLYVLFSIAVVYFFYVYTSGTLYWAAASVSYVIYMMLFLNNQLVPQFFALVLLIFLFSLGSIDSMRLRFLQLFFYTALVLSHPFFFIFYLSFLTIFPFVRGLKGTVVEIGGRAEPMYVSLYKTVNNPFGALSTWILDSLGLLKQTLPTISALSGIYVFFFFIRFELFSDRALDLLSKEANTQYGSSTLLMDLLELIGGTSTEVAGPEPRLLYSLSSQPLHRATAYVVIAIFTVLLLLSLILFILKSVEYLSPVQLSIGLAGVAYYIGGFFLPIIGVRGLQLGLLPMGALMAGWKGNKKIIKVVVLLVLVLSPVVGLNGIVNASISGGSNTQSYHAHEAGEHIVEYGMADGETVLKDPSAGLPPEFTTEQDENVVTVEEVIRTGYRNPSLLVYGPRQVHAADRYRHRCNFAPERRNILFDNGVEVLSDSAVSDEFSCTRK